MPLNNTIRPFVIQPVQTFILAVGTVPTPIAPPALINNYVDAFIISVPTTAANSVFWGDVSVSITNGVELIAGSLTEFDLRNERQLYELQEILLKMSALLDCKPGPSVMIPFLIWDLSQVCLIAAAATNVVIAPFKAPYI